MDTSGQNPWKTLSSRLVYENRWLRLREDQVLRPDGQEGIYSVLELPESVGVIAANDKNEVALVRQWRYALKKISLEIPTGGCASDDQDLTAAAKRELREETGLTAESWIGLGSVDNSNGATTDVAHIFLATELHSGWDAQDAEEKVELVWLDFDTAVRKALDSEITESVSVAGLLRADARRYNRVTV